MKADEICQVGQPFLEMEVGDDVKVKEEVKKEEHAEPEKKPEPKPEPKAEEKPEPKKSEKVLATPAVRALAQEMGIDLKLVTPTGKSGNITKNDILKFAESQKSGAKPAKQEEQQGETKVLATPAVRGLAGEMNVDLKKVKATGKGGRITKEDVMKYAESQKGAKQAPAAEPVAQKAPAGPLEGDRVVKLTGIRKAMAKSMTDALTIPPYNIQEEFYLDKLKKVRKAYLALNPKNKLTYLPFFVKAFSQAMLEYPVFNSHCNPVTDKEGYITEYVEKADHNISIAVDSPSGLLVPNIKAVQTKSILQINEEIRQLIERARAGNLTNEDLSDGTFTVSNIGNIGGMNGTPVIFRPQVALGAIGRIRTVPDYIKKPNGELELVPREVVGVCMTCDHRIMDGATGARMIMLVKRYIEDIDSLLLTLK